MVAEINKKTALKDSHIKLLTELLENVKYGSINIIVQDGRIIQIDKTEKFRVQG